MLSADLYGEYEGGGWFTYAPDGLIYRPATIRWMFTYCRRQDAGMKVQYGWGRTIADRITCTLSK